MSDNSAVPSVTPANGVRRRPRWRRLQFALPALLAIVAIASVGGRYVLMPLVAQVEHYRAETMISQQGALATTLTGNWRASQNAWKDLLDLPNGTTIIQFQDQNAGDSQLALVAPRLRIYRRVVINVAGTRITQQGVANLLDSANLVGLIVDLNQLPALDPNITSRTRKLTTLGISDPGVGADVEFPTLTHLDQLEHVYLAGPQITDTALADVRNLAKLRMLTLNQTRISQAELDELHRDRPEVVMRRVDVVGTGLASRPIFTTAVRTVAMHPDGLSFISGSGDGSLRSWRLRSEQPPAKVAAHADWLFAAAFSPDQQTLATGGGDGLIRLWHANTLAARSTLAGHGDDVHGVAFIDDRTLVSAGDDMTVKLWDLSSGTETASWEGHEGTIPCVAASPDGRLVASGSRDNTIRLWNVADGSVVRVLKGHTDDVMSVEFSPDGHSLASASYDGTVRLWSVTSDSMLKTIAAHDGRAYCVAFTPEGAQLVSGGEDGVVRVWNSSDASEVKRFVCPQQKEISCLAVSADGATLIAGSSAGNVAVWSLRTDTQRRLLWAN